MKDLFHCDGKHIQDLKVAWTLGTSTVVLHEVLTLSGSASKNFFGDHFLGELRNQAQISNQAS